LILLSIGISFFFLGLSSLQQILKCQVDFQLDDINKTYQNQIQNLKTITSVNAQNKNDDLTYILNSANIGNKLAF